MVVAGLRETRRPASATQGLRQFLRSLPDIGDIAEGQHFCGRPQRGQGASRFRVDARCTASVACLERMAERGDAVPVCLLLQCLQYLGTLELSAVGGDALLWMVRLRRDATLGNGGMDTDAGTFRQKVEKMAMEVEDHHSWRERSEESTTERLTNLLGRHERQLEAFQSEAQALKGQRREVEATRRQLDTFLQELVQQDAPRVRGRLQVLVLHGRQSNANLANFQISGLKTAFGKETFRRRFGDRLRKGAGESGNSSSWDPVHVTSLYGAVEEDTDFEFLEGDVTWAYRPGVDLHDADPMSVNLSKGKDFKVWFNHTTDDPRERPDLYKQQDPGVCVSYEGVEGAVDALLQRVTQEPVDAVVGLFEGCIVVHLAAARLLLDGATLPWPVSVFFGDLPIRDARWASAFDNAKAKHASIHVFGRNDEYYHYGRRAAGMMAPEDYYEAPLVLEHVRNCCGRLVQDGTSDLHRWLRTSRPLKPLSPPLLEMELMVPRKLRVLALTGGHSCTEVLRFQCANLQQALGRDACEWTYIEGTEDWNWFEGEPIVSDMEKTLAKGAQLKNWYMDSITEATPTEKPNREKQYHKIPEKVEKLKELIFEEGPFDVVVAFSQGCIMMHLLIGHLRKEDPSAQKAKRWHHTRNSPEEMPWRLSDAWMWKM
eukprot:g31932.t1